MGGVCIGAGDSGERTRGGGFLLYGGSEMDLVMILNGKKIGFEFRYDSVPKKTASMINSKRELELSHIYFVYPGDPRFFLDENIEVMPLAEMVSELCT